LVARRWSCEGRSETQRLVRDDYVAAGDPLGGLSFRFGPGGPDRPPVFPDVVG